MKAFLDLLDARELAWNAYAKALSKRAALAAEDARMSQVNQADKAVEIAQKGYEDAARALRDWIEDPGNLEQLGNALRRT